jgi:hypothetical protein
MWLKIEIKQLQQVKVSNNELKFLWKHISYMWKNQLRRILNEALSVRLKSGIAKL